MPSISIQTLSKTNDFIRKYVKSVPVDISQLCIYCDVRLIPLSRMVDDGFKVSQVFGYWGNEDGTSTLCQGRGIIAYNDYQPEKRIRFTLAEEFMHIYLGHLNDSRFNMFSQDFDEETYLQYEAEAKTAAGMLLCPPKFYFTFEAELSPYALSRICRVSEACAMKTIADYTQFGELLKSLPSYAFSTTPDYNRKQMWKYRALMHKEPYEMLELRSEDR